jgi:hypothetical protein
MRLIRRTSGRFSSRCDFTSLAPMTSDVQVARRVSLVLTAPGEGKGRKAR